VPIADIRKEGRTKKKDRLAAVSPNSGQVFLPTRRKCAAALFTVTLKVVVRFN
jgi:hypothetical protein